LKRIRSANQAACDEYLRHLRRTGRSAHRVHRDSVAQINALVGKCCAPPTTSPPERKKDSPVARTSASVGSCDLPASSSGVAVSTPSECQMPKPRSRSASCARRRYSIRVKMGLTTMVVSDQYATGGWCLGFRASAAMIPGAGISSFKLKDQRMLAISVLPREVRRVLQLDLLTALRDIAAHTRACRV